LKRIIFSIHIILSTLTFAQNTESITYFEKEYYELMEYVPKSFKLDTIYKPENKLLEISLNSIETLWLYYRSKKELNLSENDKNWLENRIVKFATALFNDGKRILTKAVGGGSGLPNKMLDTIQLNNIEITILKFGRNCIDSDFDTDFISVFNDKMYALMNIEPPNRKTTSFYGEFIGRDKDKFKMRLVLKNDRTFKFWKNKGHGADFTEGLWKNKNDTLILNSKTLTKIDSIGFTISSAKWIEFNDLKFRLKKRKLVGLSNKKLKLKKNVE